MAKTTSPPRRTGVRFIVGFLILAIGIGGLLALISMRKPPPSRPPVVQAPLVRTVTVNPESGPVTIKGNGIVEPRAEIGLAPQVSGKVVWLNPDFVSGGEFQSDDVLFRLDPRTYEYNLAQIKAEQRAARARLEYTEKQIKRTKTLVQKGTATEDEYDRLLSQREELLANLAGLESRLQQAQKDLDDTIVTAPFRGRVRSEEVDIGEYLTPGEVVARLFPIDEFEIVVPLNDRQARLIPHTWGNNNESGKDPVPVVVSTRYGNQRYYWDGYVHRTEAAIDAQTRTVNMVIRVPRPDSPGSLQHSEQNHAFRLQAPPLVPGMYITANIQGITVDRYFSLPRSAIREGNTIWSLSKDDTLLVHNINVIQEVDGTAKLVAPDLTDDARVITSELSVMTEGMKLRTMENTDKTIAEVHTGS